MICGKQRNIKMAIFSTEFGVISHKETRETDRDRTVCSGGKPDSVVTACANTANKPALCQPFVLFLTITINGTNWEGNALATLPKFMPLKNTERLFKFWSDN